MLNATIELLKDGGPAAATARAICAAVGVKQPALYYHYGQLESLHQAAVSAVFEQVAGYYQPATDEASALASIQASWQLFMQLALENPKIYAFIHAQIIKSSFPPSVDTAFAHLVHDVNILARTRPAQMAASDAAQLLWAGATGAAALMAASNHNTAVNTALADELLNAILGHVFTTAE